MDRNEALQKLRKRFGKQFAWRVDPKAPSREEREAAEARQPELNAAYKAASEAATARYEFLLKNDAEYQALRAASQAARKAKDENFGICNWRKITVGTANSLFFHVSAEGDSWEEIFEKLEKKKVARDTRTTLPALPR